MNFKWIILRTRLKSSTRLGDSLNYMAKRLKFFLLFSVFLTSCTEVKFHEYFSALDLYTVVVTKTVSAFANGDQKASLHLRVLSHDGEPMQGVVFQPNNLPEEVEFDSCTESDELGHFICQFTSVSPGQKAISLTRGPREFKFNLRFNALFQNNGNARIITSKAQSQIENGYRIKSAISKQNVIKKTSFGYKITTGQVFQ